MTDALSSKEHCHCILARPMDDTLCYEMEKGNLEIIQHGALANLDLKSTIYEQVKDSQKKNGGNFLHKEKVERR